MPGIIGDRLFSNFDLNCDGYLDLTEFATNLLKIYSTEFKIKMKIVFDLYDFEKNGVITKEDVRLLLSHAPINKNSTEVNSLSEGQFTQNGGGGEEYTDRLESQKELDKLINICFGKQEKLTFEDFKKVTEKVSSEMFLCIFSLIKTHFPSIDQFKKYEQGMRKYSDNLIRSPVSKRKLASPKVLTSFSTLSNIVKHSSPTHSRELAFSGNDSEEEKKTIASDSQQKPIIKLVSINEDPKEPLPSTKKRGLTIDINCESIKNESSPRLYSMLFCECGKPIIDYNKLLCENCINQLSHCEGYLYKKGKKQTKKYWILLEKRELYRIFICNI